MLCDCVTVGDNIDFCIFFGGKVVGCLVFAISYR